MDGLPATDIAGEDAARELMSMPRGDAVGGSDASDVLIFERGARREVPVEEERTTVSEGALVRIVRAIDDFAEGLPRTVGLDDQCSELVRLKGETAVDRTVGT